MGLVYGLKKINSVLENNGGGQSKSVPYLKLNDGETVKVRFLQELDPDSPNYNDKAGLGALAVEHQKPGDFKVRAGCSYEDEGRCWACEQHRKDFKAGWRPKTKLYINVLVTRQDGTQEVKVLSQGNGPKSITPWLLEYAGYVGSITDREFKMKRQGSGQTDTAYTLTPLKEDATQYDVSKHELVNLEEAVRTVPYDKQEEFFGGIPAPVSEADPDVW